VRTRILFSDIRGVNLCDLKTISIRKILEDYFCIDMNNSMPVASDFAREMRLKTDNANGTELIRDIFLRIRQLLPVDVLEG
jgi:propanediol utilization protein